MDIDLFAIASRIASERKRIESLLLIAKEFNMNNIKVDVKNMKVIFPTPTKTHEIKFNSREDLAEFLTLIATHHFTLERDSIAVFFVDSRNDYKIYEQVKEEFKKGMNEKPLNLMLIMSEMLKAIKINVKYLGHYVIV